jgi:hypothetical protein
VKTLSFVRRFNQIKFQFDLIGKPLLNNLQTPIVKLVLTPIKGNGAA